MKKILILLCLLVALTGVVRADFNSDNDEFNNNDSDKVQIITEIDEFDNTKYIFSCIRLPGIKEKGMEVKNLIFRKQISTSNTEYLIMFQNTEVGLYGQNRFPLYNKFLVKFDDDNNEIYTLPKIGDAIIKWGGQGGLFGGSNHGGFHEVVLSVPENVVEKILTSNKMTIRVPLDARGHSWSDMNSAYTTSIRNFTFDINEEIMNEWKKVINAT